MKKLGLITFVAQIYHIGRDYASGITTIDQRGRFTCRPEADYESILKEFKRKIG